MALHMVVLPCRTSPAPHQQDLVSILSAYVDHHEECGLSSQACRGDFQRLHDLRLHCCSLTNQMSSPNDDFTDLIESYHEYYNYLLECETTFEMHRELPRSSSSSQDRPLEWTSALTQQRQVVQSLTEERANIIWNLVCFEAEQASHLIASASKASTLPSSPTPNHLKAVWNKAAEHLQTAASWIQHVPPSVSNDDAADKTTDEMGTVDFSNFFLDLWQAILMACAQHCWYESVKASSSGRPKHLVLAKLAASETALWGQVRDILLQQQHDDDDDYEQSSSLSSLWKNLLHIVTRPPTSNENEIIKAGAMVVTLWEDYSYVYAMYMSSLAEYHQAMVHGEKKELGLHIARLNLSLEFATMCAEYCRSAHPPPVSRIYPGTVGTTVPFVADFGTETIQPYLEQLHTLMGQAINENIQSGQVVPEDFPDIRGQKLVNVDQPLTKLLLPMQGEPLFQFTNMYAVQSDYDNPPEYMAAGNDGGAGGVMSSGDRTGMPPQVRAPDSPVDAPYHHLEQQQQQQQQCHQQDHQQQHEQYGNQLRQVPQMAPKEQVHPHILYQQEQERRTQLLNLYTDRFRSEMERLLEQYIGLANERTESAHATLAMIHLPHSLKTFEQEQQGGGIPLSLWEKVDAIQQEQQIPTLKKGLWELRDMSEQARTCLRRVQNELESDLEADRLFRQENPNFQGRDVVEEQREFQQTLTTFERLLEAAQQEGDKVLLQRLEQLNTNPKFKLLQFPKSQLDRLIPSTNNDGAGFDTSRLNQNLAELSSLLNTRQDLLQRWQTEYDGFDVATLEQQDVNSPAAWEGAVLNAISSFDDVIDDLRSNIENQGRVMDAILAENEVFVRFRNGLNRTSSSSLGSARSSGDSCLAVIEDAIEDVEHLWTHLKDGTGFYGELIPKIEKLQQEVGDTSARLTVERLEYDDEHNRYRQEEADAELAKRMSSADNQDPASQGGGDSFHSGPRGDSLPQSGPPPGDSMSHARSPNAPPAVSSPAWVSDSKAATLEAMGFDPGKVAAALTMHNNDVDRALNELLSG